MSRYHRRQRNDSVWIILFYVVFITGAVIYGLFQFNEARACNERGGVYVQQVAAWPTCLEGGQK